MSGSDVQEEMEGQPFPDLSSFQMSGVPPSEENASHAPAVEMNEVKLSPLKRTLSKVILADEEDGIMVGDTIEDALRLPSRYRWYSSPTQEFEDHQKRCEETMSSGLSEKQQLGRQLWNWDTSEWSNCWNWVRRQGSRSGLSEENEPDS